MGDEFDDLDIEVEPRPRQARRLILGEDESGDRVEIGDEVDADAPIAAVPAHADEKGEASGPTEQQREWWDERANDEDLARTSFAGDSLNAMLALTPGASLETRTRAGEGATRLGRRGLRAAEEWLGNVGEGMRGAFLDAPETTATGAAMDIATAPLSADAASRTFRRGMGAIAELIPEDVGNRAPDRQITGMDRRGEAPIAGLSDSATLGWDDEIGGAAMSGIRGTDYETERDSIRGRAEEARAQAPAMYEAGQAMGTAPWLLAPNPAGWGGRSALNALMGGLDAAGHSQETGAALAGDTALGALLGVGLGAAGEGALAVARGPGEGAVRQRALSEMRDAADDSLLAATGHAGNNAAAVRAFDFGDTPGQIREHRRTAAQILRDTNAVPAAGGMRATRRSIEEARRGATDVMDDVRTAMGTTGPTGTEVAERMRRTAAGMDSPTSASVRDVLDDFAERYGGIEEVIPGSTGTRRVPADPRDRSPDTPIDYEALMRDLANLRKQGAHRTRAGRDVPLREEGLRDVVQAMRGSYDDALESQASRAASEGGAFRSVDLTPQQREALARLGDDPVASYHGARQRYAVLEDALGNAQRGEEAIAGNRGIGMSEMQWGRAGSALGLAAGSPFGPIGALGGGAIGGALGAGAARGWRGIEPRVRARGNQALYDLAQRMPELSESTISGARRALGAGRVGVTQGVDEVVVDDPQLEEPAAQPVAEAPAEDPLDAFGDLDIEFEEMPQ